MTSSSLTGESDLRSAVQGQARLCTADNSCPMELPHQLGLWPLLQDLHFAVERVVLALLCLKSPLPVTLRSWSLQVTSLW